MQKTGLGALLLCAVVLGSVAAAQNYQTPGNLAPQVDPGCIGLSEAGGTLSPPDLALGVQACAKAGRWDDAFDLFVLMQLRARYDSRRVADRTAHQAEIVLAQMVTQALPFGGRNKLEQAMARFGNTGSPRHKLFCTTVRSTGPAHHSPEWMVQHGMAAFRGIKGDGLIEGFDPQATWRDLLRNYMHCG